MLIDLCLTSSLLRAGQMSTQTEHPVQSSGATWTISLLSGKSLPLVSAVSTQSGAPSTTAGSTYLIRMAAWGHTSAHRPQSMQIEGSQMGISRAIDRFSHCEVAVGKVPSA